MLASFLIRPVAIADHRALWGMLEPMIREGETYALPRAMTREEALSYWLAPENSACVLEQDGTILGTFYLRANQRGGGAHVANAGYVTAPHATGRGVARAMCAASLEMARDLGFRAMQFNFVVSSNARAVTLWRLMGFEVVGRLPDAFERPTGACVDALVMFRAL